MVLTSFVVCLVSFWWILIVLLCFSFSCLFLKALKGGLYNCGLYNFL